MMMMKRRGGGYSRECIWFVYTYVWDGLGVVEVMIELGYPSYLTSL